MKKNIDMIISIYKLVDPLDNSIRYVGRTKNSLKHRLNQHLSDYKSNHNKHKKYWIKNLLDLNLKPKIRLIKKLNCSWEESHVEEQKIIVKYFKKGYNLVNLQDKGCGSYGIRMENPSSRKAILQYDLEGNLVKAWESLTSAATHYKIKIKLISKCLTGISHRAHNFMWKYKTGSNPIKTTAFKDLMNYGKRISVIQYSLEGGFIKIYSSATTAALDLGLLQPTISNATIKNSIAGGFQWRKYTENFPAEIEAYKTNKTKVKAWNTSEIKEFDSLSSAGKFINVSYVCVRNWCNKKLFKKGYNWEFN